ncbi:MAG: hypothetical protein IPK97_10165 [Ahniella sp.]|nr:hypothetical protein [Ahniella sp.]
MTKTVFRVCRVWAVTEDSGFRLSERFADLLGAGFRYDFLCIDIDRDGMLTIRRGALLPSDAQQVESRSHECVWGIGSP